MLRKNQQDIVFIVLIAAIVIMTVKALTMSGRYDREIGELRKIITQVKGDIVEDKEEGKEGSLRGFRQKLESHWHKGMKRKVIFE